MSSNRISKIVLVLLALAVVLVSVSFATRSHVALHENAVREFQLGERYGQTPQEYSREQAAREVWLGERYGQTP